tara:strand:+ start:3890 stop:4927 length:1038 start_codon:yes stop_codon:yes gene_type:complete
MIQEQLYPISDGAASFDGTDDYIDTGFQPNFIHTNATMSYWCRMADFSANQVTGCHNSKRFYLGFSTDNAFIGAADAYKSSTDLSAYVSVNTWMHLCLVMEDGTATYYLDGVSRDTLSYTQASATNPDTNFLIGAVSTSPSPESFLEGNICNVGIWSTALTQAQIKSIMYKDYAGLTTPEKTNLVSWWDLDEAVDSNNLHVADLVNDTLGSTPLTNSDFATGDFTGWTSGGPPSGAEVVSHDGHLTAAHITTSSNDHGYNQNVLTAGQVYKVSFDIKVISGSMYLGKDGTQVGGVDYTDSSWTSYTHYWTAPDTYFRMYSEIASSEFYIDNISVQPTNGNYGTLS